MLRSRRHALRPIVAGRVSTRQRNAVRLGQMKEHEHRLRIRQRVALAVSTVVFLVVGFIATPLISAAFPSADLVAGVAYPGGVSPLWSTIQLYFVLCLVILLPACVLGRWSGYRGSGVGAGGLGLGEGPHVGWVWVKALHARENTPLAGHPTESRSRWVPAALSLVGRFSMGLGGGLLVISLLMVVLISTGWYRLAPASGAQGAPAAMVFALALAALYEELLFRGFGFWLLERMAGVRSAVLVSSIAFGLAHSHNVGASVLTLANTVLAGLILAVVRMHSGSLWTAWGIHLGWNVGLGLLFGARTSGFAFESRLFDARATAEGARHVWLSGGDYGPEGSILLAPLLVAWLLWISARARRARSLGPSTAE